MSKKIIAVFITLLCYISLNSQAIFRDNFRNKIFLKEIKNEVGKENTYNTFVENNTTINDDNDGDGVPDLNRYR